MRPVFGSALFIALGLLAPQTRPAAETAREIVSLLLAEKYAAVEERFTDEMKKAVPEEQLRVGASRLKQFGAIQKVLEPEMELMQGMVIAVVPVVYEKLTVEIRLTLDSNGRISGLFFRPRMKSDVPWSPPPYSHPESFSTEEVVVGTGEWKLPGTLALPKNQRRLPALVLVHGSGPNDRDETVGGAKVFRDLAEGLASRGIATLRYEKRTREYSTKLAALSEFTVEQETVDDALAAAELLRGRSDIDPARVYVLGHSLGGYIAPRIGKRDPKLAGLIIMAGNTRRLEDLILEQTAYIGSLQKDPAIEKTLAEVRKVAETIRNVKPGDKLPPVMGAPVSYWLDLKDYRPAEMAGALPMPMLILQGERDYQVTMTDFAAWKAALGSSPTVTFRSYPALNHLFIEGQGKSTPTEYARPGHVAAEVIDDVAKWILRK